MANTNDKSAPPNSYIDTRMSRIEIGFQEKNTWMEAPATFTRHSLEIQGHPVMEDWEDGYMQVLAKIATSTGGAILEIGYGMGISARYIQKAGIDWHIVIEANQDVYRELVRESGRERKIFPVLGFWEDVVPELPAETFDGILFDTYPLSESEIHKNHFPFFSEAYRLLRPDGMFTYYSDESEDYTPEHIKALNAAGFTKIDKFICDVNPPPDCQYWRSNKILAPIIQK